MNEWAEIGVEPGEHVREKIIRLWEGEFDGGVVYLRHRARLAVDGQGRVNGRVEILVVEEVFPPEHEVVGIERLAV